MLVVFGLQLRGEEDGVKHRRYRDVGMSEQIRQCSQISAVAQVFAGEGMPEAVGVGRPIDAGLGLQSSKDLGDPFFVQRRARLICSRTKTRLDPPAGRTSSHLASAWRVRSWK